MEPATKMSAVTASQNATETNLRMMACTHVVTSRRRCRYGRVAASHRSQLGWSRSRDPRVIKQWQRRPE